MTRVHYPGLPHHLDHNVAREHGNVWFVLGFEVAGGLPDAIRVYDRFRVIARAVSLGA